MKIVSNQLFSILFFCLFSVETCEQQTRHGRQLAAEALLCMESPSTSSEGKTFLQGILQQQQNGKLSI